MVYILAVGCPPWPMRSRVLLQRMGVEDAPSSDTLRLSLMAHALKRGVWLLVSR